MTEDEAKNLKVGDKVRYVKPALEEDVEPLTIGKVYTVKGKEFEDDPYVETGYKEDWVLYDGYCASFELVTEDAPAQKKSSARTIEEAHISSF